MSDITACIPAYNNSTTVVQAVRGLQKQTRPVHDILLIDDGSTDGTGEVAEQIGARVLRQPKNMGRGAARARAFDEIKSDYILFCDGTNELAPEFLERAMPWFENPKVAAVFGFLTQPNPRTAVERWRGRHIFKSHMQGNEPSSHARLITHGVVMRRSAVLEVGNFKLDLRQAEDAEMGDRLLKAGYDVIRDPHLVLNSNAHNSLPQVLERYWRWHAGYNPRPSTLREYASLISYSISVLCRQDYEAGDPSSMFISLLCPHYQFWYPRWKLWKQSAK